MKKYGLLTCNTPNIGDDIQNLAAAQFLPTIDYYIDRDHVGSSKKLGKCSVIVNGWFMHKNVKFNRWFVQSRVKLFYRIAHKIYPLLKKQPSFDWPPSKNIRPLFISFHVNPRAGQYIASPKFRKYYKKFEPIGCRDHQTVELFKKIDIKAYFSGCLTLTLKNKFSERNENIYFVDPFGPVGAYEFPYPGDPYFNQILWNKFPKGVREKAIYLTHAYYGKNDPFTRLEKAQKLVDIYSKAKLIITSRLHCALPCLALGTPVIFLYNNLKKDGRFNGLTYLLRKYSFEDIANGNYYINWENPEPNPISVSEIAGSLVKKCEEFIKE